MQLRHTSWIVALSLFALSLALRWGSGANWYYNPDEAIDWTLARSDTLAELHGILLRENAHPPGYFYLLRMMLSLSDGVDWLRLPALLAGSLLAPVLFAWVRRLAGLATGAVAGLLVALSTAVIEQSDVVRPYAIMLLALVVALWALEQYRTTRQPGGLVLYSASLLCAIALHYSAMLVLAPVGVLLATRLVSEGADRRTLTDLVWAHIPIALLLAAIGWIHLAPAVFGGWLHDYATGVWMPAQYAANPAQAWTLASVRLKSMLGFIVPTGLAWILFGLGIATALRSKRPEIALSSAAALLFATGLSLAGIYPLGDTRHSLYLLPFLILPVAYGVGHLITGPGRLRRVLGAILLAAIVVAQSVSIERKADKLAGGGTRQRFISRQVAARVAMNLNQISTGGGLVITDVQTLRVLQPLLKIRNSQIESLSSEPDIRGVSWRGLDFVIPWTWHLGGRRSDPRGLSHLADTLEALSQSADIALNSRGHRIWLVQGGWGRPLLRSLPARGPTETEIWSSAVGGRGLLAAQFDPAAYLAWLSESP